MVDLRSVEAPLQRVSNAAAPSLSGRTVARVAQRETQNEDPQEWFWREMAPLIKYYWRFENTYFTKERERFLNRK